MTNHDTDPTTEDLRITCKGPRPLAEIQEFFGTMLTDDDESAKPLCPCGCGAVEHGMHGRKR